NWVHPEVVGLLADRFAVDANTTHEPWPADEVRRRAADADALLAFMTDTVDAGFVAACPRLRIVACALKGFDNFDVDACTRAGVWVSIVPDLLTAPTAELAVGLAIALGRRVLDGDRLMRRGDFVGWRPQLYGSGLAGSTVGIAGLGAVGQAIARRLAGFEARLIGYDARPLPAETSAALALEQVGWTRLLEESDLVLLALPLNDQTRHLLGREALANLRPGCLVVNAGRGSVVDEAAVADALASGRLGGYAADVFEMEDWALADRPRRIPQALLDRTDRTVFTPHLGSAVDRVRLDIALAAARNVAAVLDGREPPDAVNRPTAPRR
ncbi:NAD(P)-dependent oxidoreductase, partial [Arenibaculum sp.]|uniref:NAD(P)-dependent oxidoreductase n=1 Tax=Arenibaculum sp. TaxID=2865862 RepID=UPI002E110EC3|nr:NAD(P)-dependent oxidoreductase [Arenibaculum sp.]